MNNICIVCFNHQKFDNNLPLVLSSLLIARKTLFRNALICVGVKQ